MKDYKEMADSVLGRIHEYEEDKRQSRARVRNLGMKAAIVMPVLLIAAVGTVAVIKGFGSNDIKKDDTIAGGSSEQYAGYEAGSGVFAGEYHEVSSNANDSGEAKESSSSTAETAVTSAVDSSTASKELSKSDSSTADGKQNPDEWGNVFIAAIPNNNKTQVTGEKITEEEAKDYFLKNAKSLQSSLTASGVNIAEIAYEGTTDPTVLCISGPLLIKKGYCHISYDGSVPPTGIKTESPKYSEPGLTVKQNFMDFHVYNTGKLIAIVTLVKENGLITATPAFGAPWFDSFNNTLKKYSGQKVLFLYAGAMAFAITPDNKVIHPQGNESSVKDSGLDTVPDAYKWFYNEQCVYTP